MKQKDLIQAKDKILEALSDYIHDRISVPEEFHNHPDDYKEFHLRSAIVGNFGKLRDILSEENKKVKNRECKPF